MTHAQNATSEPSFHLVVLAGPDELARGFLQGLYLGAGHDGFLDFACGEAAEHSLGERLRELIGRGGTVRAVLDGPGLGLLRRAEPKLEDALGLRLLETRRVAGARFRFHYRAFTPAHAEEIAALLAAVPAGASRTGGDPVVRRDPDGKGVEAYAPVHDYEAHGEGEIAGRVDAVVLARRALTGHALVQITDLALDLA